MNTNYSTEHMVNNARRGLILYLTVVAGFSVPLYVILHAGGTAVREQLGLTILLMWVPALAALVVRLLLGKRAPAISLKLPRGIGWTLMIPAILMPVLVGFISYGAAWSTGLAEFSGRVGATAGMGAQVRELLRSVGRAALLGTPIGLIIVAGEEIGWRGYVAPLLRETGLAVPRVLGGLIWATWHAPLILTGQYAGGTSPVAALVGFSILAVALHILWTSWTERTRSLWPAIVAHSAWNAVIQYPFDSHTTGDSASFWVGDSGFLTAGICLVFVLILVQIGKIRFSNVVLSSHG